MATQNPLLPVGQYVQYDPAYDDPRAPAPSSGEKTIGQIKSGHTAQGEEFYQVVWNPGDMHPTTGLYHRRQLCPLSQQQASDILCQIAKGNYQASLPEQGSGLTNPQVTTLGNP